MFNLEGCALESKMAPQHHVAASLPPSLVRHWNNRQKVLSRDVETVERREHRSPSARAVFNFDRQSWMDDGWRGGRGGIFPDYWGVVKRRTAAD